MGCCSSVSIVDGDPSHDGMRSNTQGKEPVPRKYVQSHPSTDLVAARVAAMQVEQRKDINPVEDAPPDNIVAAVATDVFVDRRVSLKGVREEDYVDPFENMSDEEDEDQDYSAAASAAAGASSQPFLQERLDRQESVSWLGELDETKSSRLAALLASGTADYASSKMTEIDQVKQHAMSLKDKFDMFFNPLLVRALLEIVRAKEFQIQKAFDNGDISMVAYMKLMGSLEDVTKLVAKKTNRNTVKTTRRVLRRTRTLGSMFESNFGWRPKRMAKWDQPNPSGTAPVALGAGLGVPENNPFHNTGPLSGGASVPDLIRITSGSGKRTTHHHKSASSKAALSDVSLRVFRVDEEVEDNDTLVAADLSQTGLNDNAASAGDVGVVGDGVTLPDHRDDRASSASSTGSASSALSQASQPSIKSLLQVCVNEAFVSMLASAKDDLVGISRSLGNVHLAEWVSEGWQQRVAQNELDYVGQAEFLDRVSAVLELHHAESKRFAMARSRIKQMVSTLELVTLQMQSKKLLEHCEEFSMFPMSPSSAAGGPGRQFQ